MELEFKELEAMIQRYEEAEFTINRQIAQIFRCNITDDLTNEQYRVMRYIHRKEKTTSSDLAEIFCVGKSAITSLITRLAEKKLIRRVRDKKDRRVVYLSLTPEGQSILAKTDEKICLAISKYILQFNSEEIHTFINLYERLASLMKNDEIERKKVGE